MEDYKKKKYLKKKYYEEEKTLDEIGEKFGVNGASIAYWMEKHGLDRRDVEYKKMGSISFSKRGYVNFHIDVDGERKTLGVHRLNALMNHSLQDVIENDVHHKNGVKWDNRFSNLELINHAEHASEHENWQGNGVPSKPQGL